MMMSDDPILPPNDDQASREFEAWMKKRHLHERDDTPAAQEFVEMMRQAAQRNVPLAAPGAAGQQDDDRAADFAFDGPLFADDINPDHEDARIEPAPVPAPAAAPAPRPAQPTHPPARRRSSTRRGAGTLGFMGGFLRTLIIVLAAAGLTATIFTWFTPNEFINAGVRSELSAAIATDSVTAVPTLQGTPNWARRIGIVAGHRGPENDPGAVCPDGLTEGEINFNVAQIVVGNLRALGYTVDLLDEFDSRLGAYQAAVLVSIHSNTCRNFGEVVSGYLISGPSARVTVRDEDRRLVECVSENYAVASALARRDGVTEDMTDYHNFREIDASTPAAILELGFMLADREVLTQRQDALAQGITNGILCFLEPGPPSYFASTPAPSATPLTEAAEPAGP